MITSGEGRYKVWLDTINIGMDTVYLIGGGEKSHIGGVVICEPGKSIRSVPLKGHRDEIVLKIIAQELSKKHKKTIIVIGGIHIDNATPDEIEMIIENCKRLTTCI